MQFLSIAVLLVLAALGAQASSSLITPVNRVLGALKTLRSTVESEGVVEQKFYDKFACRVQDIAKRKEQDITDGEAEHKRLSSLILKLSAEIGTKSAAVKNLQQDITDSEQAQKEADETRASEHKEYLELVKDTDSSIYALRAAIKVLSGTGTGGFLQQGQVMSIVGRVRAVLDQPVALRSLSDMQIQELQSFLEHPADSLKSRRGAVSALQVGQQNNPFGDYAPGSDVIMGIMKQMLAAFSTDVQAAIDKEETAQEDYDKMKAKRSAELHTLTMTLGSTKERLGQAKVEITESHELRAVVQQDLKNDKAFLQQLKADASKRSAEHSDRSRYRAQELLAMEMAIKILDSPDAQRIFRKATQQTHYVLESTPPPVLAPPVLAPVSIPPGLVPQSFLQIARSFTSMSQQQVDLVRQQTYSNLKMLAVQAHSTQMAKIAEKLRATGHFDEVIKSCQEMMQILRAEEKADIEHRDRCQSAQNANKNDIEDLQGKVEKLQAEIENLDGNVIGEINSKINEVDASIESLEKTMQELLGARNEEHAAFKQAVKDDTDMIALLDKAILALAQFYENNKIPLGFVQVRRQKEPEYTEDMDKLPDQVMSSKDNHAYDSANIISILTMIKTDSEKELQTSRADEAKAQANFVEERAELQATIDNKKAMRAILMKEKADASAASAAANQEKGMRSIDLEDETTLQGNLKSDCTWVKTHFASRAEKRKNEMEGLTQAIAYLSGIEGQ